MAILKGGSVVNGELNVNGDIYINGETTGIMAKINSNYAKIKTMLGTAISLPTTYSMSGTVNTAPTAYMIGNTVRISFKITLSKSLSGNIDNTSLGTVTCTHNGKIQGYVTSAYNSINGSLVAGYTEASNTSTAITYDFLVSAVGNSFTAVTVYSTHPVRPNLDKF